jgi:uncharacterized protein
MNLLCRILFTGGLVGMLLGSGFAQTLPPAPAQHVADRAGILSARTVAELNTQLAAFEQQSSSQVVVWTERTRPANEVLEDYVNRVFQAWKIGQRGKDNGVLLAVFTQDRALRIEVGYGLEGALPDALAGRIIANEITPRFKQGDFEGGIRAGVKAILAATQGEYQPSSRRSGRRTLDLTPDRATLPLAVLGGLLGIAGGAWSARREGGVGIVGRSLMGGVIGGLGHPIAYALGRNLGVLGGLIAFLVLWSLILSRRRGRYYDGSGGHTGWSGWSGGGSSSGWSGGGGGFSGGGGSSGGGGASGSW